MPTDRVQAAETALAGAAPDVVREALAGAAPDVVREALAAGDPLPGTAGFAGVDPVTPLLADRVVAAALRLSGTALASPRGERKWGFRLAARVQVPDRIAFREKTAIQYGSDVDRELDRLARQAGYKQRMDDHVSRYVESLL